MNTYLTHDNGGRPFKVIINDNNVSVFNNETNELLFEKKVEKVFVGTSPKNKMTIFSGGFGADFIGNSILLKLENKRYQFIGESIFTFDSYDEIVDYVSPVGNNDVPYPYAIDESGNIYLLIEDIVLINTDLFKKLSKNYKDPYCYYYDYSQITDDLGMIPPQKAKIKDVEELKGYHNIKKFFIDNDFYTLRYDINPLKRYDNEKDYGLIMNNGDVIVFSKEYYLGFHNNYAQIMDFRILMNKEIQYNRLY